MTPLKQLLGIAIDSTIPVGSEQELVDKAIASDGVVLIAWHHEKIPAIANLILQNKTAPQKWPGDRFDVVWIFTRAARERAVDIFASAAVLARPAISRDVIKSS